MRPVVRQVRDAVLQQAEGGGATFLRRALQFVSVPVARLLARRHRRHQRLSSQQTLDARRKIVVQRCDDATLFAADAPVVEQRVERAVAEIEEGRRVVGGGVELPILAQERPGCPWIERGPIVVGQEEAVGRGLPVVMAGGAGDAVVARKHAVVEEQAPQLDLRLVMRFVAGLIDRHGQADVVCRDKEDER